MICLYMRYGIFDFSLVKSQTIYIASTLINSVLATYVVWLFTSGNSNIRSCSYVALAQYLFELDPRLDHSCVRDPRMGWVTSFINRFFLVDSICILYPSIFWCVHTSDNNLLLSQQYFIMSLWLIIKIAALKDTPTNPPIIVLQSNFPSLPPSLRK